MLIGDLADDLFDDVFDRHQARHAAVLVHHQRHVVAAAAEILQQHVDALGFGHEYRRPQPAAKIEGAGLETGDRGGEAQQIFRQQDAFHLVLGLADHRKSRVAGLDHHRQNLVQRPDAFNHAHLAARNHDVTHLELGHAHDAFDHGQGVGVHQLLVACGLQDGQQIVARLRAAGQVLGQQLPPGRGDVFFAADSYAFFRHQDYLGSR